MKINTALILCAGLGKRLNPLTLTTPKPLLRINDITILERCINLIIKFGAKKILLNTFHLSDQIFDFIKNKKFSIDIQIIEDGKEILNTGGGILNMIENSRDNDFIIFNPDTLWHKDHIDEIKKMQNFYFDNKLNNILLLANRKLSFDKSLTGGELLETVCHEMVHVWQSATRKMKDLTFGRKMYMGKVYDETTAYEDEPWEIEAYAMQGDLLKKFEEEYTI